MQLSVQDKVVHVKLLLVLPDISVDLNEEVYTADVIELGESLSFSLDPSLDPSPPPIKSSSEPPPSSLPEKKVGFNKEDGQWHMMMSIK